MKGKLIHLYAIISASCLILLCTAFIFTGCSFAKKIDLGGYAICPTGTDIIILNPDGTQNAILEDKKICLIASNGGIMYENPNGGVFQSDVILCFYNNDTTMIGLYSVDNADWIIEMTPFSFSNNDLSYSDVFSLIDNISLCDNNYTFSDSAYYKNEIAQFDFESFKELNPEITLPTDPIIYPLSENYYVLRTIASDILLCNKNGEIIHPEWGTTNIDWASDVPTLVQNHSIIVCSNYLTDEKHYFDVTNGIEILLPSDTVFSSYKENGFFYIELQNGDAAIYDSNAGATFVISEKMGDFAPLSILGPDTYIKHDFAANQSILYQHGVPKTTSDFTDLYASCSDDYPSIVSSGQYSFLYDNKGTVIYETTDKIVWVSSDYFLVKKSDCFELMDYQNHVVQTIAFPS